MGPLCPVHKRFGKLMDNIANILIFGVNVFFNTQKHLRFQALPICGFCMYAVSGNLAFSRTLLIISAICVRWCQAPGLTPLVLHSIHNFACFVIQNPFLRRVRIPTVSGACTCSKYKSLPAPSLALAYPIYAVYAIYAIYAITPSNPRPLLLQTPLSSPSPIKIFDFIQTRSLTFHILTYSINYKM